MLDEKGRMSTIQVKVCGITRVEEALACAALGVNAIGCVFYPPSPRFVSDEDARVIRDVLPQHIAVVGVFVDEPYQAVMERVRRRGLDKVQLHGRESPELVARLEDDGVSVIKTFFANREPTFDARFRYRASAWLVECAGGKLPGGNALEWNWNLARPLSGKSPLILAGGLNPENVAGAAKAALPDAVDVSSGVEIRPGHKDLKKVARFVTALRDPKLNHARRVF